MKTVSLLCSPALFCPALACLLLSCASTPEEVREREAEKTRKYADYNEKRKIRQQARDERTELWYDRIFSDDNDF